VITHFPNVRILTSLYFSEYYPQNIMQDRRIARGNTYAAMVIPAGTNPDALLQDKSMEKKKTIKRST
jgi:hypothetical protein